MRRAPLISLISILGACESQKISCGPGTFIDGSLCVAEIAEDLEPGRYEPPLVELQELIGREGVLGERGGGETDNHTTEVKFRPAQGIWPDALFYCGRSLGVLDATTPGEMTFLAQGWTLPGSAKYAISCNHMAFDDDDANIVYLTNRGTGRAAPSFLSGFDLGAEVKDEDLSLAPRQLSVRWERDITYEGVDAEDGLVWIAAHEAGLEIFERAGDRSLARVAGHVGSLRDALDVLVLREGARATAYVADGAYGLVALDVSDPKRPAELFRIPLEGIAVDLAAGDGTLYVAAQSGGVHAIDIRDPSAPLLLSSLQSGSSAVALSYSESRLFVAAWNDARVFDVSDPKKPTWIGAVREQEPARFGAPGSEERPDLTTRVLAIAGDGEHLYNGAWRVPSVYDVRPEERAPYIVLPETAAYLSFPGDLSPGEAVSQSLAVYNDGNEPLTIFEMWSTNPTFSVSPGSLRIEPGRSASLELTFSPALGSDHEETGELQIRSDDPSQPVRVAYLVGNSGGLSVGDPYHNNATLLDGTPWSFASDSLGSVTLISYFTTSCPVCALELPEIEAALWEPYRQLGLSVIAIDADEEDASNPERVGEFVEWLDIDLPIAVEQPGEGSYAEIVSNLAGNSPVPLNIIVDKAGIIRYFAREYDPTALESALVELLAAP